MFTSSRDQSSGRRSRVYSVSKAARSSKLSLLSAASGISATSTGSTSTITQDSYSHSRSRNHDGRTRRKRKTREVKGDGITSEESVLAKLANKDHKSSPDVFDFLVDGNSRRLSGNKPSEQSSRHQQDDHALESDPEYYYRGQLSDSGISMGSSGGESGVAESPNTILLPPLVEENNEHNYSSASSVAGCTCFEQDPQNGWHEFSGRCYHCEQVPFSPASHAGFFIPPNLNFNTSQEAPLQTNQAASGLITSPIIFRDRNGSRSTPRVFRRFRRINARVLLQMQARIAELEHELRTMDIKVTSSLAQERSDQEKPEGPSREEQTRRANIYQELRIHLDQYYQALVAAHQVDLITKPPTVQETQSFRKWIGSHILNRSKMPSLISEDSDLICFKPPARTEPSPSLFRIIALSAFIHLLVPLMLFKFLSGILNRLILWSVIIVAGAMAIEKLGLRAEKIYTTCIIAFGGISLGASLSLDG